MATGFSWPDEHQGAVSLTYDDGLEVHCSVAGPLLGRCGLRATFYPMIRSDLLLHAERWKELAAAGNELGNHSVFHPCRQRTPQRYSWLDERYDLSRYSLAQMRAELEVANLVLQLLDDKKDRTYGCTCGDLTVGAGASEEPLEPVLRGLFVAARGTLTNRPVETKHGLNLFNIGCINAAGRSLQDLVSLVEDAREARGWAVLVIHGIGAGTHDLYLETDVHEGFVQWLGQQKRIWTAPVRTVATFLRDRVAPSQRALSPL